MIKDGTGKGYRARVDEQNRLDVHAVTLGELSEHVAEGYAYTAYHDGFIVLTGSAESHLLYLENTGDTDLVIERVVFATSDSTSGSVGKYVSGWVLNPTTGSIVARAKTTGRYVFNKRMGDAKAPSANVYVGIEGDTATDVDGKVQGVFTAGSTVLISTTLFIPKSTAFSVYVKPPSGNVSMSASLGIEFYTRELGD
jgi:hypothetical protein